MFHRSEWEHAPGIWNEEQVTAWKKVVDGVHSAGGAIFAQVKKYLLRIQSMLTAYNSSGIVGFVVALKFENFQ